jgi:hypothetical protein
MVGKLEVEASGMDVHGRTYRVQIIPIINLHTESLSVLGARARATRSWKLLDRAGDMIKFQLHLPSPVPW